MIKNYLKKFKFKRLTLKKGQAIFFHPNLIHGGSINKGNYTRLSVEIRMFNKVNAPVIGVIENMSFFEITKIQNTSKTKNITWGFFAYNNIFFHFKIFLQ